MAREKVEDRGLTAGVGPSQHRESRMEMQVHQAKLLPLFELYASEVCHDQGGLLYGRGSGRASLVYDVQRDWATVGGMESV